MLKLKRVFDWDILVLFSFSFSFSFCFFNTVFSKYKSADDWILTTDIWCKKQPHYQLSHNHCPKKNQLVSVTKATSRTCFLSVCTTCALSARDNQLRSGVAIVLEGKKTLCLLLNCHHHHSLSLISLFLTCIYTCSYKHLTYKDTFINTYSHMHIFYHT